MKTFDLPECACGNRKVELMDSDEGVDVYRCPACFDWFEVDTFVPHAKKHHKVRRMRATDE